MDGVLNFYASPRAAAGYDRFTTSWRSRTSAQCANTFFDAHAEAVFSQEPFEVSAFVYDGVITLASAMAAAGGPAAGGAAIYRALLNVSFDGASGRVEFDGNGDRRAEGLSFALDNWVRTGPPASDDTLTSVGAATFSFANGLTGSGTPIRWVGGGHVQPLDMYQPAVGSFASQVRGCSPNTAHRAPPAARPRNTAPSRGPLLCNVDALAFGLWAGPLAVWLSAVCCLLSAV
jgi:hypothetical protein